MIKGRFESVVVLGQQYKHKHSKIKGIAMSVNFYLYGCARVGILPSDSKDNIWLYFDEAELENVTIKGPGGPRQDAGQRR